jgi:hypothetical protein
MRQSGTQSKSKGNMANTIKKKMKGGEKTIANKKALKRTYETRSNMSSK